MERFDLRQAIANQRHRGGTGRKAAGLVIAIALMSAAPGSAADWLAPAADQTVTAPWVNDIAAQLEGDAYRNVFMNAMGNSPQSAAVRYLNSASQALDVGNKPLAQSYVDRTIAIFDEGVLRGYYSRTDVEPIKTMIRTRAEAAIKGEPQNMASESANRWTGYTHDKPLGLTNESTRMASAHPAARK